jgi:hypothetical protein
MISDVEEQDHATYVGFVVKADDPRGEHRACCEVPNVTDDTGWARPRRKNGVPPREGQRVLITYEYGNPERPLWEAACDVQEERPADMRAAGAQAHLVHAWEVAAIGPISFRVTLDERPATRAFRIYAVDTQNADALIAAVELDLVTRGVLVYGLTGVEIRSTGFIQLTAAMLQLNDRAVLPRSTPV